MQATRERIAKTDDIILVLQDTTEFSFKKNDPSSVGFTRNSHVKLWDHRRPVVVPVRGVLLHFSLALTTDGLPLGLTSAKVWTRKKFKDSKAIARKINRTRVPIEEKESYRWIQNLRETADYFDQPQRCVHVGDRESDIYELYCEAEKRGAKFIVRIQTDRLAEDGSSKISEEMKLVKIKGRHRIEVRDAKGNISVVNLELQYRQMIVNPPIGKQKRYPNLPLTIIYARDRGNPKGRKRIEWKLITNLPVKSRKDAIEKMNWYALRWKIEVFHKILKSGWRAEESKLRTAERLANLIAVFCILSWRVFRMTMLKRTLPSESPGVALTKLEIEILNKLVPNNRSCDKKDLSSYFEKVARLGGYLARANDSPPGSTVMWHGVSRLTDVEIGYDLAKRCG